MVLGANNVSAEQRKLGDEFVLLKNQNQPALKKDVKL